MALHVHFKKNKNSHVKYLIVNLRFLRTPILVGKFQFLKLQLTFTNTIIYKMCLTQVAIVFPNGAYLHVFLTNI